MSATRIPVVLLTGFLGSGKTTLLNRLLALPGMTDTLVIVNEYGDASLDHLLVSHTTEQPVVELAGGCVCCSLRGDLAQTLRDAHWRFARAGRRQFERVVIETTGLADPAPVLGTLTRDERIRARYRHAGTLTLVDATHAADTIAAHDEAVRQITAADHLLISKSDLVCADALAAVRALLDGINPFAGQTDLQRDSFDAALLTHAPAIAARYRRALPAMSMHDVRAESFRFDVPIHATRLEAWLADWPAIAGTGLLRMKALLDVAGHVAPLVLHGVQHTLYPPESLPVWPDDAHASTIVFITRGMDAGAVRRHVEKLAGD
jgi:G3E family GTPase